MIIQNRLAGIAIDCNAAKTYSLIEGINGYYHRRSPCNSKNI